MPERLSALDPFDLRLLELLQENCRRTAEQLSEHLGLSPAAVQKRLKRLRETGVVEREIAILDPGAAGRGMTIIVEVSMERENLGVLESFKRRMQDAPLVQQCYYTTGEADFTLILVVRDIAEYQTFTQENFFGTPEVSKFKTSIVMDRVKVGLGVSLDA
ncbi:Lrp/AsnC family transcriptional regulator [Defluviimonas sp. D31]|uniref:Lrp/AsnC family transcriptional regulator n=1 Tax=Defluviimonas sp. D31 TaxID=3083253 RepID=UPI00296F5CEF|nr:Lrp/AsnC family transcriptional regulator [Defluviimonas sp. D31]MDW4550762.1 Lrp/AsnC family transcriptional regulator [Defluviimonas sp. D31]